MESRAHARDKYTDVGAVSWMQDDLALFAQDLSQSYVPRASYRKNRGGSTKKAVHVGVVGGGLAGLRCASVLLQHGVKVTMYEGRDRLGGRVSEYLLDECKARI